MKQAGEGVIKFHLNHVVDENLPADAVTALRAWFQLCRQTGLVGQDSNRYEGYAYGNLSRRWQAGFVITCTQTGAKQAVGATDFALVTHWHVGQNELSSRGPCKPSSEALTHGMIYQALPAAGAVIHAHSPQIWSQAERLSLTVIDPGANYGTPAMALAVSDALASLGNPESGMLSMGGHTDGVLAWNTSLEGAGGLLVKYLARALQLSMNPALSN